MKQNVLGVIGGLGPLATAYYMARVVEMTDAEKEQDNVDMIVYNFPSIPDRTDYILGNNQNSPLPGLRKAAKALEKQGVSCIAIPCVTAHYFHQELQKAVAVPIINAVAETAKRLKVAGIQRAGIMATDGTVHSRILGMELEHAGINPIMPSAQKQRDIMSLIYESVKAQKPVDRKLFYGAIRELVDCGSEAVILGCTELSVIRQISCANVAFLDVMDVLAQEAIVRCGKKLKPEFRDLLKGDICLADQSS